MNINNLLNRLNRNRGLGENTTTKENTDSQYFVDNCGKEDFGTIRQLEEAIKTNNHKISTKKEVLNRLINFWEAMNLHSNNIPKEYQVAGQWVAIIDKSFKPLTDAFNNKDLESIEKLLNNFFRVFGDFFGEPTNYNSEIYRKNRIERFKLYSSRWIDLYGENSFEEIIDPQVGNPVGFLINGDLFTQGNFINNHFARRIEDLIAEEKKPAVCEIGGGFGGVAYHLIKRCPTIKYINYDIPMIAILSAYYLMMTCPESKIGLFGEINTLEKPFEKHNIIIAPNYAIKSLGNDSVDLCLNKCSFAEMDKFTVAEYMKQFERICRGFILHMNHSWEQTSKNAYQPNCGFKHWNLSEIEPNQKIYRRIYKIPAPFQSDFHGEFFEWLYEKRDQP